VNAFTPAPRGFRWADSPGARLAVMVLAACCLLVSVLVGWRQNALTNCLRDRDTADQARTRAIAQATDAERVAERTLIMDRTEAARQAVLRAYAHTDEVRQANPAPAVVPC
jgi:hypothetical protein